MKKQKVKRTFILAFLQTNVKNKKKLIQKCNYNYFSIFQNKKINKLNLKSKLNLRKNNKNQKMIISDLLNIGLS